MSSASLWLLLRCGRCAESGAVNFYLYLLYLPYLLRFPSAGQSSLLDSHGGDLLEFIAVLFLWRLDIGLLLDWLSSIFDHSPVPIPEAEISFLCLQLDVVFHWTIHL